MKSASEDNISVFLRVRPLNEKEQNTESIVSKIDDKNITVRNEESEHEFAFDRVFGESSTQQQIYEKVGQDVVQSAFQGFNGTIFAYGQTSSGKTHTCIGPDYEDEVKRGILPRLIEHTFSQIAQQPPYIEFRIKISMVEIYLEKIKDLLEPTRTDVRIRQNKSKGIYLQDITEEYVASPGEAMAIFKKGVSNRTIGQTNMNDESSRSHMAFIITLHQNNLKDVSAKSGKIILVDLAGSEKVSKTQAGGKLLDEAKNINKSLSALGNVINSLTDPKATHIPYRDSKLTRLLQESLGGNSKTRLIINVSPSLYNFSESLSSLRFGFRAKQIKNKPRVNREYTVAELLILLDKAEKKIEELEGVIREYSNSNKKRLSKSKAPSAFIENLLDSDNPILSGLSETEEENEFVNKKSLSNVSKLKFQSEAENDVQDDLSEISKQIQKPSKDQPQDRVLQSLAWNEEKQELMETIRTLDFERNENYRQVEIFEEKYEMAAKEARLLSSKYDSGQRENQKILQQLISFKVNSQAKEDEVSALQQKLNSYEESIKSIVQKSEQKSKKISKVFGKSPSKLQDSFDSPDMEKLIEKYQTFKEEEEEQNQKQQGDKRVGDSEAQTTESLKKQVKKLEGEIAIYKGLQETKEALIKEKMQFVDEKDRIYKDLQNRIQKVLQLEESLDELREKNRFLEDLVKANESEKGRKIMSLQMHLDEVSENYYVLKGQQSSWLNNNKRYEKKLKSKETKIDLLEAEVIELKAEIQALKMSPEEAENQIDLDFTNTEKNPFQKKEGRIVKVLRSSQVYN